MTDDQTKIALSWDCPAVSWRSLKKCAGFFNKSEKAFHFSRLSKRTLLVLLNFLRITRLHEMVYGTSFQVLNWNNSHTFFRMFAGVRNDYWISLFRTKIPARVHLHSTCDYANVLQMYCKYVMRLRDSDAYCSDLCLYFRILFHSAVEFSAVTS